MPEGDTVWRTAQRLHQALAGREVTRWELRWPSAPTTRVTGRRTIAVVSRGKHLLHRLEDNLTLHSHLRMEGQWRIAATRALTSAEADHHAIRAVVGTAEWTALGHRLGMLDLVASDHEHEVVGHLGPDVLGYDWDPEEVLRRLSTDPRPVAEALLDQRVLAGVGTMWASEALFLQRLHPWASASELPPATLAALLTRVRTLLWHGKEHAVQSSTGSRRRGQTQFVHARSGRPCRRCGDTVRVAMVGTAPRQRTIFSCPTCQGGLAPTDDGAVQRPLGYSRRPGT